MNTKTTIRLMMLAITLFAVIWLLDRRRQNSGEVKTGPPQLLPDFRRQQIVALEYSGTNDTLRAERAGDGWRLTVPVYPAQNTPIEALLDTLAKAKILGRITAREVIAEAAGLKAFGLEPPAATITLHYPQGRANLKIGSKTPLVDQFYVQKLGEPDLFVIDAALWRALPKSAQEWRSPQLVQLTGVPYDRILIRSGSRLVEVERTNRVWRLTKPLPARADSSRIEQLVQQINLARVNKFVSDLPTADLERYGLQTPELELHFLQGTNRLIELEFGSSPTNDPTQVYARRLTQTNIVTVDRILLEALNLPYKAFHDSHLANVEISRVDSIEVHGLENFTLQKGTNGVWQISQPVAMPADARLVRQFLTNLASLEIVDFAKDVPTDTELREFGLMPPSRTYVLRTTATNAAGTLTNMTIAQMDFGTNRIDTSFARRPDETPAYLVRYGDLLELPKHSYEVRDRKFWNFPSSNIVAITSTFNGISPRLVRNPSFGWAQDPIINAAVEESLYRTSQLEVAAWTARGDAKLRALGFNNASFNLKFEVVTNSTIQTYQITFGSRSPRQNIYATIVPTNETERLIFEFPGSLYADLVAHLGQVFPTP
ncbi:MAG: DUF4340 domain-containing protein [Verrucomicrobia bacterium]|nr:MAG: DUF4340 domain-containing protein [Verrucomicrobiota bacterium]